MITPERREGAWSLQRVTRLYIRLLGVFYLVLVLVALVTESAAIDPGVVLYVVVFGAMGVAIGGPVFFVVVVLPGWIIWRAIRRFVRGST